MDNGIASDGRSDAAPAAVVHSNPITQAGHTTIPNVVMLDQRLSIGAKITYGYLKHLAWRTRNETIESALVTLCRDLGVSENTMRGYLRELAAEGVGLVESKRRGLGLPNLYIVHDPKPSEEPEEEVGGQELRVGNGESAVEQTEKVRVPTRGREKDQDLDLREDQDLRKDLALARRSDTPASPPKLVKVEGRDRAFDALARECSVDPNGNRAREVAAALNGAPRSGLPQGIRELAWRELPEDAPLEGPAFEGWLAARIQARARRYREKMGGAMLTPLALAKWWTDIEAVSRGSPGKTSSEILEMALEREEEGR